MTHEDELERLFDLVLAEASENERAAIAAVRDHSDSFELDLDLLDDDESLSEEDERGMFEKIRAMTVPQKIKLALFGNLTARNILIRDANSKVAQFVLANNRLTENEITEFARNTNLDDSIYRGIAKNHAWTKQYSVKLSLVANPRVPIDVALSWTKHIKDKDLERLAKSKQIAQVVAAQCRKILDQRKHKESPAH